MRRLLLVLLLATLLLPWAAALVTAERVGDSAVQVFAITETQVVALGEEARYTFAVFNGHATASYLVRWSVLSTELGFAASLEPDHMVVGPQGSDTLILTLRAPDAGRRDLAAIDLRFQVVNLETEETDALELAVEAELLGIAPETVPVGKVLGLWPNPLPAPLDNVYGAFAASVAIWVLVALAVVYVAGPVTHAFVRQTESEVAQIVLRILRGPVFLLLLAWGAVTSVAVLGLGAATQAQLQRAYAFVLILAGTWIAYRVFRDLLMHYAQRLAKEAEHDVGTRLLPNLDKVGALVIVVVGVAFALQSVGVDLTLLLAGMGVVGLIVAFAAQDTLSNFFAGIHMMLDRPFQVGDLIEIEPGVICEVQDIGLRSTKLYWGKEHDVLIIPNKEMANRKIVNYFKPDYRFKTNVKVGVAYGTDLDRVERILKELASAHPDVPTGTPEYEPLFRVAEFGDNAIVCLIIFWVRDARLQWGARGDLMKAIAERFKEEGIAIAFPQRDVWVREWPEKGAPWKGGPP